VKLTDEDKNILKQYVSLYQQVCDNFLQKSFDADFDKDLTEYPFSLILSGFLASSFVYAMENFLPVVLRNDLIRPGDEPILKARINKQLKDYLEKWIDTDFALPEASMSGISEEDLMKAVSSLLSRKD